MGISEHSIQVKLIQYIRIFHPEILIFSIPNGANTTSLNRVNLVKEGLLSGVPDLFVAHNNNKYCGLFIEMKKDNGLLSNNQKIIINKLINNGYKVEVCRNLEDAKEAVLSYISLLEEKPCN